MKDGVEADDAVASALAQCTHEMVSPSGGAGTVEYETALSLCSAKVFA